MPTRFRDRYLQIDLARSMRFDRGEVLDLLGVMSGLGYNGLCLYLEGSFAFESLPGAVRPGVMTPSDAAWLLNEAGSRGITVMPMTNLFGHMEEFVDQERLDYLRDGELSQVSFTDPAAEDFGLRIAREYSKHFKTTTIHIGGDEADLDDHTRPLYGAFLGKMCRLLLGEGITPVIWSDMIWMHQELLPCIPRETVIFDWNYYGHRPASLKWWRENGFESVFVCPGEESWEGFINCQRVSGHLKAQMEPDVEPDEIEAFTVDAFELGIPSGCLTAWEHRFGSPLWAQMVPIARAGLYMSGGWQPGTDDEPAVENALFGRITPFTKLTRLLQNKCQTPIYVVMELFPNVPRNAIYQNYQLALFIKTASKTAARLLPTWQEGLNEAREIFAAWEPASSTEERCRDAMGMAIDNVAAAYAILLASDTAFRLYHEAALGQFDDPTGCATKLGEAAEGFDGVFPCLDKVAESVRKVAEASGYPIMDVDMIAERKAEIAALQAEIRALAKGVAEATCVPIPAWRKLVDKAIRREPIRSYL